MCVQSKKAQVWVEAKNFLFRRLKFLVQPFSENKKAQVWVETVIYTLIALTIIGLFLSFAKPKVEEIQDKAIIDQSIDLLNQIDSVMSSIVEKGSGNQRILSIGIKKGSLEIDGISDQIIFEIDGKYTYSEPGENGAMGKYINIDGIFVSTQERGSVSTVTLLSNYTKKYNISYKGLDEEKTISRSAAPYKMVILNVDSQVDPPRIDFDII